MQRTGDRRAGATPALLALLVIRVPANEPFGASIYNSSAALVAIRLRSVICGCADSSTLIQSHHHRPENHPTRLTFCKPGRCCFG